MNTTNTGSNQLVRNLTTKVVGLDVDESKANVSVFKMPVEHGEDVRADITVESFKNGRLRVSEKLTAMRDVATDEVATLYIGAAEWLQAKVTDKIILNHIQEPRQWNKGEVISDQAVVISYR